MRVCFWFALELLSAVVSLRVTNRYNNANWPYGGNQWYRQAYGNALGLGTKDESDTDDGIEDSLERVWFKRNWMDTSKLRSNDRIWMKRNWEEPKRGDAWWNNQLRNHARIWFKKALWSDDKEDGLDMNEHMDEREKDEVDETDDDLSRDRIWMKRTPDNYDEDELEKLFMSTESLKDILSNGMKSEDDENAVLDDDEADEEKLRYHVDLNTDTTMQLNWDIDDVQELVYFELVVRHVLRSDMIGFGFSDYGEPENGDFVVLWTDSDGKHYFQDMHTDESGVLRLDESQDYRLDGVRLLPARGGGGVSVRFHRAYDTCDDNDYVIDSGTTHLVFFTRPGLVAGAAAGAAVPPLGPGLQRVQIVRSQLPDAPLPDDTQTFTMHVDNVPVPDDETTYWCAVRKLPAFPHKMHIVKYESAITPASVGVVHHMEVFHCQVPEGRSVRAYDDACKTMAERPKGLESCRNVIGAWAMGAEGVTLPEEAGFPIGGKGFSQFVMLEVHYNNPQHKSGLIDSSGIKFHVTEKLRQYDAGIIELGLEYSDKYAIPPLQPLWKLEGHCIPDCTKVALPEDGINIFSSQLHTHLTGKQVYLKHYRNGVELPEVNRDNHYSPHYQEIRKLPRQVRVMPGDSLVTTCVDSTQNKSEIVMGGFAISDEMCVSYNMYYPKIDLEVCKSSVTTSSLYGFFDFLNEYQHEPTSPLKGINDNFHSVDWKPLNAHLFKTFLEVAPLSMQCNRSSGDRFPGNWEGKAIPTILAPLPPEERPCLT